MSEPPPLVAPPSPDVVESEQDGRSATPLELFFDLAFVLVVAALAARLSDSVDLAGAATFIGLFAVTWWAWASFAIYANRFDTDDVVYRLAKLTAMFAVVVMAATAEEATGDGSVRFALGYVAVRAALIGLYARAYRHVPTARRLITVYLVCHSTGLALWLVSVAVPTPARFVLWGVGLAAEVLAPLLATHQPEDVRLHPEHLPERLGLFVILVLFESVTAVVDGLRDTDWSPAPVAVGVLGFAAAAALWWTYFDLVESAPIDDLLDEGDRSSFRHDVWIYGQLPITLGLVGFGVGVEHAVVEASDGSLTTGTRVALAAGAALFLVALELVRWGVTGRARVAFPLPALAVPVLAGVAVLELSAPAPVVGGICALLVLVTVTGRAREREEAREKASA